MQLEQVVQEVLNEIVLQVAREEVQLNTQCNNNVLPVKATRVTSPSDFFAEKNEISFSSDSAIWNIINKKNG